MKIGQVYVKLTKDVLFAAGLTLGRWYPLTSWYHTHGIVVSDIGEVVSVDLDTLTTSERELTWERRTVEVEIK